MNYKYRLIDTEYILSEKEHNQINDGFANGINIHYLRGGTLMINMSFVRAVNETGDMTDEQKKEQEQRPKLAYQQEVDVEKRKKVLEFINKAKPDFYKKMGWVGNYATTKNEDQLKREALQLADNLKSIGK